MATTKDTATIYLKSGSQITFELDKLVASTNGLGHLTKLDWEGVVGKRLMHLDFSQIEAVVYSHAPALTP